jgi:hypothetical protein
MILTEEIKFVLQTLQNRQRRLIVNENWLSVCNRAYNYKIDVRKTIKNKKEHFLKTYRIDLFC